MWAKREPRYQYNCTERHTARVRWMAEFCPHDSKERFRVPRHRFQTRFAPRTTDRRTSRQTRLEAPTTAGHMKIVAFENRRLSTLCLGRMNYSRKNSRAKGKKVQADRVTKHNLCTSFFIVPIQETFFTPFGSMLVLLLLVGHLTPLFE